MPGVIFSRLEFFPLYRGYWCSVKRLTERYEHRLLLLSSLDKSKTNVFWSSRGWRHSDSLFRICGVQLLIFLFLPKRSGKSQFFFLMNCLFFSLICTFHCEQTRSHWESQSFFEILWRRSSLFCRGVWLIGIISWTNFQSLLFRSCLNLWPTSLYSRLF